MKLYNAQRQIFKDWGFPEREAREIAISALDTYLLKNRLNDQLKQCFFYPLSSYKNFAMTSENHNQDITSLITLDYFKFASYVSKCLKIKIYTVYNLKWDGQGNISYMNQSNAIKKIIQFKFLEKYYSSQIFIEINKSVQQKKNGKRV